ncbi:hypothetical protein CMI39_01905 [Candidatus Pacearchaeota archaeon]|jgi:hypothetical protein|nr:hypothetical protein [Candidatus Pacearchaeota archaeon]|tara:strand:- start:1389 stop:1613 length:225 start_codon:yes stop_codon:yes gene_type:complete
MKIYSTSYSISNKNIRKIIEHYKKSIKDRSVYLGGGYFGFINNKTLKINTLSKNKNHLIKSELEDIFKIKLRVA